MRFTYDSGQRILDGYTLKRGIGRGGFGEVYYGVSDGGKEVALKLVRGHNVETELRGMAQCLNLKHPNLLTLYDMRRDAQGDHWVIMEYIGGESLSAVLGRHPQGLPHDLIRQWFPELAEAVAYLHSHGIVHRDLKPGNIFLENGAVKVGDYGLCKFISSTQHSAQTQSVGTVHYMAPEISTGNYNKQIYIYAAGVILYEMLSGRVPFDGESAGEILMKHLTSPPDLGLLPVEFAPLVGKALAKNPAQRFVTMTEMAHAVRVAGVARAAQAPAAPAAPIPTATAVPAPGVVPAPSPVPAADVRGRVAELGASMLLATLFAAVAWVLCSALFKISDPKEIAPPFFLTVAASWAVLVPAKMWNGRSGDQGFRRTVMLLLGVAVGLGALWLDNESLDLFSADAWAPRPPDGVSYLGLGYPSGNRGIPVAAGYLSYFGLALFALRWWKMTERNRAQRFNVGSVVSAAFWGFVLLMVWPGAQGPLRGALPIVLTSAIVQLVSPWEPPPPPASKRLRLRYT